jgi:trans-aconitate 2-methyltransferase
MNNRPDWDPDHYLKFKNERTQPSIDLVSRISIEYSPENIVDIGCGPGNSSRVLSQRWPVANIVGVDNSAAMIEKAQNDYPDQKWILADALDFEPAAKFDIVFSNATIQWIPNHERLFDKLTGLLSPRGAIAIQLPRFRDMVLGRIIHSVSRRKEWEKETDGCSELFTCHDVSRYYDLLATTVKSMDMWETDYVHVMPSPAAIVDWIKGSGMRPYLDRIDNENRKKNFELEVLDEITKSYPAQRDGKVLFPFKRLFFIGYK